MSLVSTSDFLKNLWNARKRSWNALWALGTEPPAPWNARQRTWNALGLLEPSEQPLRLSCPPIGAKEQFR